MFLIVGAGLSGAVVARDIAERLNKEVLVIDKRHHIGGNCYDYRDEETGILMNMYGAHIFHTSSERVWLYVQRFAKWKRWDHQVVSKLDNNMIVPFPVNITTVNKIFNESIQNETEMIEWLKNECVTNDTPIHSADVAKSRIGVRLYDILVKDYTFKQWGKYPEELAPSVLARIPYRTNTDARYFTDKYQALPAEGYTKFFESLLDHKNIKIICGQDFFKNGWKQRAEESNEFEAIIYTGPIDQYFSDKNEEKLEYRSINFQIERPDVCGAFYQINSVVNYPSLSVPWTRIVEYKHFLEQQVQSPKTIIVKEITTNEGEPYYPVPNERNQQLYERYRLLAQKEERVKSVYFLGRLANYKYFNMDQAILNALEFVDRLELNMRTT